MSLIDGVEIPVTIKEKGSQNLRKIRSRMKRLKREMAGTASASSNLDVTIDELAEEIDQLGEEVHESQQTLARAKEEIDAIDRATDDYSDTVTDAEGNTRSFTKALQEMASVGTSSDIRQTESNITTLLDAVDTRGTEDNAISQMAKDLERLDEADISNAAKAIERSSGETVSRDVHPSDVVEAFDDFEALSGDELLKKAGITKNTLSVGKVLAQRSGETESAILKDAVEDISGLSDREQRLISGLDSKSDAPVLDSAIKNIANVTPGILSRTAIERAEADADRGELIDRSITNMDGVDAESLFSGILEHAMSQRDSPVIEDLVDHPALSGNLGLSANDIDSESPEFMELLDIENEELEATKALLDSIDALEEETGKQITPDDLNRIVERTGLAGQKTGEIEQGDPQWLRNIRDLARDLGDVDIPPSGEGRPDWVEEPTEAVEGADDIQSVFPGMSTDHDLYGVEKGLAGIIPQTVESDETLPRNADVANPESFVPDRVHEILTDLSADDGDVGELPEEFLDTYSSKESVFERKKAISSIVEKRQRLAAEANGLDDIEFPDQYSPAGNTEHPMSEVLKPIIEQFIEDDDLRKNFLANYEPGTAIDEAFPTETTEGVKPPLKDREPSEPDVRDKDVEVAIARIANVARENTAVREALGRTVSASDAENPLAEQLSDLPTERLKKLRQFLEENADVLQELDADEFEAFLKQERTLVDVIDKIDQEVSQKGRDSPMNQMEKLITAETMTELDPSIIGGETGVPATRELVAAKLTDKLSRAETPAERDQILSTFRRFDNQNLGVNKSIIQTDTGQTEVMDTMRNRLAETMGEDADKIAEAVVSGTAQKLEESSAQMSVTDLLENDQRLLMDMMQESIETKELDDPTQIRDIFNAFTNSLKDVTETQTTRNVEGLVEALEPTRFSLGDINRDNAEQVARAIERTREQQDLNRGGRIGEMVFGRGGFSRAITRQADRIEKRLDGDKLSAEGFRKTRETAEETKSILENSIPVLGATSANLGPLNIALQNASRRVIELTALLSPLASTLLGVAGAAGAAGGALGGFVALGAVSYFDRMAESMAGVKDRGEAMQTFFKRFKRVALDAMAPLQNAQLGGDGMGSQQAFISSVRGILRLLRSAAELGKRVVELDSVATAVERITTALFTSDGQGPTLAESIEELVNSALPLITDAITAIINGLPEFISFIAEVTRELGPQLATLFARIAELMPVITKYGLGFLEAVLAIANAMLALATVIKDALDFIIPFGYQLEDVANTAGNVIGIFGGLTFTISALTTAFKVLRFSMKPISFILGKIGVRAGFGSSMLRAWVANAIRGVTVSSALRTALAGLKTVLMGTGGVITAIALLGGGILDLSYYAVTGKTAIGGLLGVSKEFKNVYDALLRRDKEGPIFKDTFTEDLADGALQAIRDLHNWFEKAYNMAVKFWNFLKRSFTFGSEKQNNPTPKNGTNSEYASNGTQFGGTIIINNNGVIGQRDLTQMIQREMDKYMTNSGGFDL